MAVLGAIGLAISTPHRAPDRGDRGHHDPRRYPARWRTTSRSSRPWGPTCPRTGGCRSTRCSAPRSTRPTVARAAVVRRLHGDLRLDRLGQVHLGRHHQLIAAHRRPPAADQPWKSSSQNSVRAAGRRAASVFLRAQFHPADLAGDRLRQVGELQPADPLVAGHPRRGRRRKMSRAVSRTARRPPPASRTPWARPAAAGPARGRRRPRRPPRARSARTPARTGRSGSRTP